MSNQIRLNKYIASTGLASRRGADELIFAGKVMVNGKLVTEPGITVSDRDNVEVEGKKLRVQDKKYVIFNKPPGYITTRNDPNDRKTIYSILPPEMYDLKSAGRLDKDSSGLLILTNDGDLIQKLTHPNAEIPKVYKVIVEGKITQNDIYTLQKGIEIEEGQIAYAECEVLGMEDRNMILKIVLYQGYNRQIRKMMEKIGHPVQALKRVSQGCITVSGLEKGKYRYLKSSEVRELFSYINKLKQRADRKRLMSTQN